MDKHEKFKTLLNKFIAGTRWLNKKVSSGTATQKDKDDLQKGIVEPMDEMWATFTDEEQEYWNKVRYALVLFNGTIVDEDGEKIKQQREEKRKRKKRWRNYFPQS